MSYLTVPKERRRPRRLTRTVPSEVGEGRGRLAQHRLDGFKPPLLAQLTGTATSPQLFPALSFQKEEGSHRTSKNVPVGDSWWSRMPRAPLHPHGCLSRCVGRHSHPSPLKGSLLGCWKVGLNEAKPGVLSSPQRALGQHTSPVHPDPTAAAHPRGPCHCHQGIRGAESQA